VNEHKGDVRSSD